ncbi:MAG: tRNA (N6-threonylcarbamoyladenosine(37)-N6)-methyltransferase TrmO [Clostridia bacterium]|nr:tRNA (N6-threonylcarbamoyladenosine(37)-N6)-methyltransferase TrmO [Clostridia bacterium]
MNIEPVAYIYTDFKEKFGIPRQSGRVPSLSGRIVFDARYKNPDALRGIEKFSHLWLIFDFSASHSEEFSPTVRPPRLGGNERVGVFASRSPFRPNSLGLSCVKLDRVEEDALYVSGVDMLDGTPIYDIKPYIPYSDCIAEATGGYTDEVERKSLTVKFPQDLLEVIPEDKRDAVLGCLAEDPRPSYHDDADRIYNMKFSCYDIHFTVEGEALKVIEVDKK